MQFASRKFMLGSLVTFSQERNADNSKINFPYSLVNLTASIQLFCNGCYFWLTYHVVRYFHPTKDKQLLPLVTTQCIMASGLLISGDRRECVVALSVKLTAEPACLRVVPRQQNPTSNPEKTSLCSVNFLKSTTTCS